MKRVSVITLGIFLVLGSLSFHNVSGQEKTKSDQTRERDIQEINRTIAEQKKAMAEQEKSLKKSSEDLERRNDTIKIQEEVEAAIQKAKDAVSNIKITRAVSPYRMDGNFMNGFPYNEHFFDGNFDGNSERTTWDFSRSIKEKSFARDYTFDVEESVRSVVMSVMGDCKAGEIRIKIIMPNGKSYSDIVIDEFGNLNWRKSFNISETENQDKTGQWKFQVNSDKATGYFKISLHTY